MDLIGDEVIKKPNKIMTHTIEDTIKVADEYNLERDSLLVTMASVLSDSVNIGTFTEYVIKEDKK